MCWVACGEAFLTLRESESEREMDAASSFSDSDWVGRDSGTTAHQPEDESEAEVHRAERCKDGSVNPQSWHSLFCEMINCLFFKLI